MQKQFFLSLTLLLLSFTGIKASDDGNHAKANDAFGQTFFFARPQFQTAMPEKETMFRDRIDAKCDGFGGAMQFVFFGGRSTNSKRLGRYFSPCPKDELVVNSASFNDGGGDQQRDINPGHFGIYTGLLNGQFSSTIKFRPRQTTYGFGFTYRQYLHSRCACEKRWWTEVSLPVIHVKNDMRLQETDVQSNNIVGPANLEEAFKGKEFANGDGTLLTGENLPQYGLIDGSRKKTAVADVVVKLGYDWIDECECYLSSFIGLVIPTGNKPKAKYLFEPIVGYNRHFAIEMGQYAGFELWQNCDKTLRLELACDSRYFIRNTQRRSFDLKDRRWSRYMLTYKDSDDANNNFATPGINVFTRKVKVDPRLVVNTNAGLVYDSCTFRGEIGYNFYARQSERVKLKKAWEVGPAIADINEFNNTTANAINRLSNIGDNNVPAQLDYNVALNRIQADDINLLSAAHPAVISHIVYGSAGMHWDEWCYPTFAGLGGSYEFSGRNTSLHRWTFWGKFGFSL